ncbi:hypothetical protein NDN08_004825 [Rhodosorus marinus]|uniref:DNA excision repair protein ERCC-1 n=1 Tax=Rhodosorus marinus TaxID=101924 RepID=A0AAV8UMD5_9RHOD|nr:hypothetical protein NDN08_004825 [Rhodosorus marinus]
MDSGQRKGITVPSADQVLAEQIREGKEKRSLFSSVAEGSSDSATNAKRSERPGSRELESSPDVGQKRQRPDSRKTSSSPELTRGGFQGEALSLSSTEISTRGMKISDPTAPASVVEPQIRVHVASDQARAKTGLVINKKQSGNPLLRHIRDVAYHFSDTVVPDFLLGQHACAIFISLRYHLLYPEYIYGRIRRVGNLYRTRVLLCLVDVQDHERSLLEFAKLSIIYEWVLICVSNNKEAGRYLESYRIYENKSADSIMQRVDEDYYSKLHGTLSSVRMVNKTDVKSLSMNFGSLKNIVLAQKEELLRCPGIGDQKAIRLYDVFNAPIRKRTSS